MTLNPQQNEAVIQTDGPILLLAGAGSGKTRVLTHRMAHLIKEGLAQPHQIMAVTFTNKAAGEMKERVQKVVGGYRANEMWVATFHSACLKILRMNAKALGYDQNFSIYDDRDQNSVMQQVLDNLKISANRFHPKAACFRVNQAKNEGLSPADLTKNEEFNFDEKFAQIYDEYEKKMRVNQAMDFGDLILKTLVLFEKHPKVLEEYQDRFLYLHVDEYQDTNRCQYRLLNLLAQKRKNICVVGDDDQSIYKFRGAEIKNILDFKKDYPEAKVIRLEQNYRSTKHILKAASQVVANNKNRMGKTLWTENAEGEKITLFQGQTERDEAHFVIKEILRRTNKYRFNDMAIFYRTNAQSRSFEEELMKNRIPYMIFGGMKFYERQEIKDITAYLRLLVNPHDEMSIKRVINVPARGIGQTTIEKLTALANQNGISLWDTLCALATPSTSDLLGENHLQFSHEEKSVFNKSTLVKLVTFKNLIESLIRLKTGVSLVDLMPELLEQSGYRKMLVDENTMESEGRLENLDEFINVVAEFIKQNEAPTLEAFLDQISLNSELDKDNQSNEKVTLMTLHLAKGLEFPIVFLVGMEEGLFPHSRSLESDDDIEEERRLCYVGMTRAMNKLHLSCVSERRLYGSSQYNLPSRFLNELPLDEIERIGATKKIVDNEYNQDTDAWNEYGNKRASHDHKPIRTPVMLKKAVDAFSNSKYKKGAKVQHPVFGVGTVQSTEVMKDGEKLTINFPQTGLKQILTKYVQLTMVN